MKSILSLAAALWLAALPGQAGLSVVNPGYGVTPYFTPASADGIISFDWNSAGDAYYSTADSSFHFGGLYQITGATTSTQRAAGTSAFAGTSVSALGNYVYYNDGDLPAVIHSYGPTNGTPSVATTTINNYGFLAHGGGLFLTGAVDFGPNHLYYTNVGSGGELLNNPPIELGQPDANSSGPLAFDSLGDLYYASGFGGLTIYRWSAADVAGALAGTPLSASGHLWLDYSALYPSFSGASSMTVGPDGSTLFLTLTNFVDPSLLVGFGINGSGAYSGAASTILSDTGRLGELRTHDGGVYLAADSQIVQVVPEPSTYALLLVGFALAVVGAHRSRRSALRAGVTLAALSTVGLGSAVAGPYSPGADQPGSTAIPSSSSSIVGWATSVTNLTRGPVDITNPTGALASFGAASDALGASRATIDDPLTVVSLGDGGSITLGFAQPIANGLGADFAVFENSFASGSGYFMELGYVDVSSNGTDFFRFPSVSLTQFATQTASFGTMDPTNIHDLAGRDIAGYGTPFDLSELVALYPSLDVNNINYVRITDVVGSIDPLYARKDSLGNTINDPFKTAFTSGGFDLDAIGVLNTSAVPEPSTCALALAGAAVGAVCFRRKA